jgi:magnesium-transporting ATPase (P-type)
MTFRSPGRPEKTRSVVNALTDPDPALLDVRIIVEKLHTDPEHGLTTEEATRRLVAVGANDIETVAPVPTWKKIVAQFRSPLIYLLLAALIASLAVWVTARTSGFTVLVITQLFNAINARSETRTAFYGFFANGWLWAAIAASALLQVAVVQLPFLNTAFTTTPLSLSQWLMCIALSSTVLWVSEFRKLILRYLDARKSRP